MGGAAGNLLERTESGRAGTQAPGRDRPAQGGGGRPGRPELDRAALELIARRGPRLKAIARRFSASQVDAEDAYQRGLEIVLTRGPSTDQEELGRWASAVIRNEALGIRRRTTRGSLSPVDIAEQEPAAPDSPEEAVARNEQSQQVAEALGHLTPQQVRCLVLRAEGYSYEEIRGATGLSNRQVTRSIYEGRARFLKTFRSIESGVECIRLRPALSAYADGEPANGQATRLRRHLLRCGSCRATLREYRGAGGRLAQLVPPVLLGVPLGRPAGSGSGLLHRLHDSLAGSLAGAAQRAQEAVDGASVTKATAVIASTAVLAGGGTLAIRHAADTDRPPGLRDSVQQERGAGPGPQHPAPPVAEPAPPPAPTPQPPAPSPPHQDGPPGAQTGNAGDAFTAVPADPGAAPAPPPAHVKREEGSGSDAFTGGGGF